MAKVESLAPAGGAQNGGSYCFQLLPDVPEGSRGFGDLIAFMDAEDPDRSTWCRYINHADDSKPECNLEAKIDAHKQLVWFVSLRTIHPGEEIHFDYGPEHRVKEESAAPTALPS